MVTHVRKHKFKNLVQSNIGLLDMNIRDVADYYSSAKFIPSIYDFNTLEHLGDISSVHYFCLKVQKPNHSDRDCVVKIAQ